MVTVHAGAETIQGRKLFKGGNYSRAETIRGNTVILSQHRTAVDTEEIYDYLDYVENPMDFDQMLTKLDNGEYHCAQDFLDDIDLVADNAVKYNSDLNYETNKVLCHRAKSLQDFAYALIKADMDTDFEDNCKVFTV